MSEKSYDLLTSGYVSMDHILKIKTPARNGFTSLIENRTNTAIYYGGCSVNIAYALCRLGLRSMPLIRVGGDYESNGFRRFLEQGCVPTEAVIRVENEVTSVCYLVQDNDGNHITLFYPGSMDGKYAGPWPDDYFRRAKMGAITVGARCDNEAFFESCKRHGLPLVFGMKGDMDAFPQDFLRELLWYCKIIFTNESERKTIEELFGIEMPRLLEEGNADIVVTTLGKRGSRYYAKTPDGGIAEGHVPICDCGPPKDATGSGDAYLSGFLFGYLKGRPVRECAMLGTVMASFAIEEEGCCTALPNEGNLLTRFSQFADNIAI